jgi:hypothetical protein
MSPKLTADEYERTAAMLRGRRVTTVGYYPLNGGDDGVSPEDWDFGAWHQPTQGVELTTDDGARFSACWGSSFDDYCLEVLPEPMTSQLNDIGESYGSPRVVVTDHPRWAPLIGTPLLSVDIMWSADPRDTSRSPVPVGLPVAIRLRSAAATVWIAAGCCAEFPPTGRFHLGTDDVMVVFESGLAAEIGIPPQPWHTPS